MRLVRADVQKRILPYTIDGKLVSTSSYIKYGENNILPSASNADTKLTAGWGKGRSANTDFRGSIRQLVLYDEYLNDVMISKILSAFTRKALLQKVAGHDNRWLFHTLVGDQLVNMVLADIHIDGNQAGLQVVEAGTYSLTNTYRKGNVPFNYWTLRTAKSIATNSSMNGLGLYNVRGMVGYGVECNIDHSGSDSTINAFTTSQNTKFVFYTDTIFVRFEARVRDITRNTVYTGAIAQVGEFILDSHIFFNSHCSDDQWHEYIITIDNAATKVKCDKILIR